MHVTQVDIIFMLIIVYPEIRVYKEVISKRSQISIGEQTVVTKCSLRRWYVEAADGSETKGGDFSSLTSSDTCAK
jgi:hypothetical protein